MICLVFIFIYVSVCIIGLYRVIMVVEWRFCLSLKYDFFIIGLFSICCSCVFDLLIVEIGIELLKLVSFCGM